MPRPAKWSTVALKSPAMITFVAGALLGEPVEVAAPVAQLPPDRRHRVHGDDARARRRPTGSATIDGSVFVLPGGPGTSAETTA